MTVYRGKIPDISIHVVRAIPATRITHRRNLYARARCLSRFARGNREQASFFFLVNIPYLVASVNSVIARTLGRFLLHPLVTERTKSRYDNPTRRRRLHDRKRDLHVGVTIYWAFHTKPRVRVPVCVYIYHTHIYIHYMHMYVSP